MSSTFPASLTLYGLGLLGLVILFIEFVPTMGTNVILCGEILAAFRAREGELGAAVRTGGSVGLEGGSAIRAEVRATGRAFLIIVQDGLAAVAAKGRPLLPVFGLVVIFVFKALVQLGPAIGAHGRILGDLLIALGAIESVLGVVIIPWVIRVLIFKALLQLGAAVGTDRSIGRHLLVAFGAIKPKLCPALLADGIVRVHLGPALGTGCVFFLVQVELVKDIVVKLLFIHGYTLIFGFFRRWGPRKKAAPSIRWQPRLGFTKLASPRA